MVVTGASLAQDATQGPSCDNQELLRDPYPCSRGPHRVVGPWESGGGLGRPALCPHTTLRLLMTLALRAGVGSVSLRRPRPVGESESHRRPRHADLRLIIYCLWLRSIYLITS